MWLANLTLATWTFFTTLGDEKAEDRVQGQFRCQEAVSNILWDSLVALQSEVLGEEARQLLEANLQPSHPLPLGKERFGD